MAGYQEEKIVKNKAMKIVGVFALPVILFLIFAIAAPGFGVSSIQVVISQAIIPIIMGYSMAFGMRAGLFDLSTGPRVILAAAMGGFLSQYLGIPGLIIGSLVGGIVVGIGMGVAFNKLRIPSMVLSLGALMLLEIAAYAFLGSNAFLQIDSSIAVLGKVPYSFIICGIMAVIFYIIYYRTKFSYQVRTVGDNEILAKNMGIKPQKVNFWCWMIGGIFVGVTGILEISYSNSVSGALDMSSLSMTFKPMMGVMIGMELLTLIDNLALNIVIGELCISIIFNGLIALGLPATMQDVVLGLFMIAVMAISANRGTLKFRKLWSLKKSVAAS